MARRHLTTFGARPRDGGTGEGDDPGLDDSDMYQIALEGGELSVQSRPQFVADGDPGDHVCITVRVSRAGTLGEASNPKCVDVVG